MSTEVFVPNGQELNGMNGTAEVNGFHESNGLPPAQPGSSKSTAPPSTKLVMDYSTDFPKLPEVKQAQPAAGRWVRPLTSAVVTETVKLPAGERASVVCGKSGQDEQHICSQISAATNTKIELCESADKSLTILITGKKQNVDEAQARLIRDIQTQATVQVQVPREFYGAIIGKEGARRKKLEEEYLCRFFLPGRDEPSEVIRIVGPVEQVHRAAARLQGIVTELAKQATENIDIPRQFYPWIRGPYNETLETIQAETGVKVNVPTSRSKNETIIISGEREGVTKAAAKIRAIYDAKKNVKTVTCKVARAQHRFIIGHQRSGLDEIFKASDCVVEVPSEEENSDTLTLRGPQENLGNALTLVYARASSIISLEIKFPEWQKRFLIGPKGATLQNLVPKQDRLSVDFEDGGVIYLEGPPEAVKNAHVALSTEIARLSKEMASEAVVVPAYLHRHIIGRQGALVQKLKEDFDVQITIPGEKSKSEEIRVEGKKEGVKKAVAEIKERAAKLEKQMPKDQQPPATPAEEIHRVHTDVDPKFHRHFVVRGAEVIRSIQEKFGGVVISFPRQETGESKVTVKGPRDAIEKAKKEIETIVADLAAQTTVNFDIEEQHHRFLVVHANDLRQQFSVNIQFPPKGTPKEDVELVGGIAPANLVQISGRPENIQKAKEALFALIPIQKSINVATEHHSSLIGKKGEAVRQIMTAHSVRIKIPSAEDNSEEIVVSGPPANVEKALADIAARVAEFDKNAEDRRARQFNTTVDVPVEYHQRLIGSGGHTVRELSKRFEVNVSIPRDQSSTITITGYEAKALEAKAEIERLVDEYQNMVTLDVQLDPRFHPRLIGQRGRNLRQLQADYSVEITFPGRGDEDQSRVLVSGKDEGKVMDCIDKLRILEEDYMQDIVDRAQYQYRREPVHYEPPPPQQIEITGAPWQLDSLEQFPTMGGGSTANNAQPTGVWGRRR